MGQVAVLGLGPSLKLYNGGYDLTIGVNDIYSKVPTDHIVCVDRPDRFTVERLKVINESTPERFYTHLTDWQDRPDYFPIELQEQYPNYVCLLNIKAIPKSLCSPFVAAAIAYKLHEATEIHLYGVDLTNHPNLDKRSCERIFTHFKNLSYSLRIAGSKLVVHGDGILKSLNK
jgi:hypothetical protein